MVGIVIKTIQRKYGAVFFVDVFQSFQIEVIKRSGRTFICQIGKGKNMVIDIKIVTFERFFIPDQCQLLGIVAIRSHGGCGNGIDLICKFNICEETAAIHFSGNTIYRDRTTVVGNAFNYDFQRFFCFHTMIVVEDRPLTKIGYLYHFSFSFLNDSTIDIM